MTELNATVADIDYSFPEVVSLGHDVNLSVTHRTVERDAKSSYQAKLLARILEDNLDLFDPFIEEMRHVVSDVGIQRVIDRLGEFCDTHEWSIPATQHKDEDEDHERYRCCQSHCCVTHGCKYSHKGCPVETGKVVQDHPCEACGEEAMVVVLEEPEDGEDPAKVLKVFTGLGAEKRAATYQDQTSKYEAVASRQDDHRKMVISCHSSGRISGTEFTVENRDGFYGEGT